MTTEIIRAPFLENLEPELQEKTRRILESLAQMGPLVIAFSGGVDSGLLSALAHIALGDQMLAVTVRSPVETPGDHTFAENVARQMGFDQWTVDFNDLENPNFVANSPERCYHCKLARFTEIQKIAAGLGVGPVTIAEGSNADDVHDFRPGARAVAELGIRSPLAEAGLTKAEIRTLARAMGLTIWDRPSAPCLATRFPYGTPVTRQGLLQVAAGEAFLRERGFKQVRVRYFGKTARLEVDPDAILDLVKMRDEVLLRFKQIGFTYIVVDLNGYRTGSMNEALKQ